MTTVMVSTDMGRMLWKTIHNLPGPAWRPPGRQTLPVAHRRQPMCQGIAVSEQTVQCILGVQTKFWRSMGKMALGREREDVERTHTCRTMATCSAPGSCADVCRACGPAVLPSREVP